VLAVAESIFTINNLILTPWVEFHANHIDQMVCDADRLQEILSDFRLILENQKTFDFYDRYSLSNEDYYNITGLQKGSPNVNRITSYLKF
jgi:hypothetical protein